MTKIEKPIFTKDELDEKKTGVVFGYRHELIGGNDLSKGSKKAFFQLLNKVKEGITGIKQKREAHEMINKFGWANYHGDDKLYFGLKWSGNKGPTQIGKSAIKKYDQLLGYYLQQAGWNDVFTDDGIYVVPLDNQQNLDNLRLLSTSIGFYYKGKRPTEKDLETLTAVAQEKNINMGRRAVMGARSNR